MRALLVWWIAVTPANGEKNTVKINRRRNAGDYGEKNSTSLRGKSGWLQGIDFRLPKLFYTDPKGILGNGLDQCPDPCEITTDRSKADLCIYNVRWLKSLPSSLTKRKSQKFAITFYFESPFTMANSRNKYTVFLKTLADRGVDWTVSYQDNSDFFWPMFRFVPNAEFANETFREELSSERIQQQVNLPAKKKLVLWLVSNCETQSGRLRYAQELFRHLPMDRVGWYGCGGAPNSKCPKKGDCAKRVHNEYKFYLAFENSLCNGYITEKFFHSFRRNLVPVVRGGLKAEDYKRVAPSGSYINVDDFSSPQDLAKFLLELDKDDERHF